MLDTSSSDLEPASVELRPYQRGLVEDLRQGYRQGHARQLAVSPTGSGKCLGRGTPILMFNGSVKAVENVRAGDLLMGPDSKPRRVISLARGREAMYRVTPVKGDAYVVNESHILSLKITGTNDVLTCGGKKFRSGDIANVSVRDYMAANKTFHHCAKGWRVGVEFRERNVPAELPPYILGAWLGDGNSRHPSWTGVDREVFQEIKWHALAMGLDTRDELVPGRCPQVHITSRRKTGRGESKNVVKTALKEFGLLRNKHVPDAYKFNSKHVRLEVLAGLMDTDGSLQGNGFDYVSKLERLADDVVFLARSVGLAAYKRKCRKVCGNNGVDGTYFRVSISGNVDMIPTRIARKRAAKRQQVKDVLVTGITVEPIGEGDYYGFEIDGDRLFLLGDFTVTHNTVLFAFITKQVAERGQRVFIVAHRREILDQISRTLTEVGVDHGFVQAGKSAFIKPVMVASIQTLARRLEGMAEPDVVIVDEAHHSTSDTYVAMFARWQKARYLGVTATPERLDGAGLGTFYTRMVMGPAVQWLIENGFLARPVYYAPRGGVPDLDGVKKVGGDYSRGELSELVDRPGITGDAVNHYRKLCPGQRAVAFCVSVEHAKHVAQRFTDAGIPAASIDGTLEEEVRRGMLEDLKSGKILVLTSCELISEGFDLPTVNAAILLRPTASLSMHLQQLGRALRMFPGKKEAVILDHAGNCLRHGLAEQAREWSLEGKAKRQAKEKPVETKTCPKCFAIFAGTKCPQCGNESVKPREITETDGELERLTAEEFQKMAAAVARRREEGACRTLEDWQRLGRERGHKPGWAWHRYNARRAKAA